MTPKNSRVPAELLEECYQRLVAGESIAACLQRYPAYAAQLWQQLQAIASLTQARSMPARNPIVAAHTRAQFVEAAMQYLLNNSRYSSALTEKGSGTPIAYCVSISDVYNKR